jgi:DNA-directed RNA polymerase specialized sigma24 family protein
VAVLGELQNEAATRLAVSPDAARKRYQRAIVRLRTHLEAA